MTRARTLLDGGARRVILGSCLFDSNGARDDVARQFADAFGYSTLVAAIDSRGGQVVIHGWNTTLPVTAAEAARILVPHVGRFLYTHVDTEGLLQGLPIDAVRAIAAATRRPIIAAGGIRSQAEIDALEAMRVDAVVGMAIYRGLIDVSELPRAISPRPGRD